MTLLLSLRNSKRNTGYNYWNEGQMYVLWASEVPVGTKHSEQSAASLHISLSYNLNIEDKDSIDKLENTALHILRSSVGSPVPPVARRVSLLNRDCRTFGSLHCISRPTEQNARHSHRATRSCPDFARWKQLGINLTKTYWLLGRKSELCVPSRLLRRHSFTFISLRISTLEIHYLLTPWP
jgi:hypothetical protein